MNVVVLIPAHNEEDRIGATVWAAAGITGVHRVVVVDDGSTDKTSVAAARAGAEVVHLRRNAGKGRALDIGLAHVGGSADVLVLLDGDLGPTAAQGGRLIGPVVRGEADMTVARFPPPDGKAGLGFVKGLARWGISMLGGDSFVPEAPLSGQRAIAGKALKVVTPFAFGYGVEVALTIRALRADMRIVEVPTTMAHAATGRSVGGFAHRGRQFAHVAWALLRLAFERSKAGR